MNSPNLFLTGFFLYLTNSLRQILQKEVDMKFNLVVVIGLIFLGFYSSPARAGFAVAHCKETGKFAYSYRNSVAPENA